MSTATAEVSFNATKDEYRDIAKCVKRMADLNPEFSPSHMRQDLSMDLTACNANGCPLDLKKLLAFDDFNFAHDVVGIWRHIDRNNGNLLNHFLPRCSKPTQP